MEFKDILVHIDNSRQCANRLELAVNLAKKHNAHLTGLYVVTHSHFVPQATESIRHNVAVLEEMFRKKTEGSGISGEWLVADWATVGIDVVEVLNYHAHQKDLIIVGQVDPEKREEDVPSDLPERVILGSGRPVLVVPYAGTFSNAGERVIVAWKAGRASARAVNDAMPFMLHSKEVFVLSITPAGDQVVGERRADGDICPHLERHNIKVKAEHIPTENPVANVLMNFAWDHGCDLIVTGAYAHSRGTLYLGPVARQLLDSMTVPVLMSH